MNIYHSRNSRRRRTEGGWTATVVAGIQTFEEQKKKKRHVLTPAFTQHVAVHYSTNLSAPTAESLWQQRGRTPNSPGAIQSFLMSEELKESLIERVGFKQHTLICIRK